MAERIAFDVNGGLRTIEVTPETPPEGTGPNSRSSPNGKCPIDYVNLVRLIARS